MGAGGTIAASIVVIGAVLAAVHHAEVVAHRVGEPFGTLVLAVSVTVIEVSLIGSLILDLPLALGIGRNRSCCRSARGGRRSGAGRCTW